MPQAAGAVIPHGLGPCGAPPGGTPMLAASLTDSTSARRGCPAAVSIACTLTIFLEITFGKPIGPITQSLGPPIGCRRR